mmetsp:Transcript_2628/g.4833  ORF Transcript_2628/g.4833 Transcript_2628/m.4833 type:complete len:204 (-) Transcript_2628:8-619(-)
MADPRRNIHAASWLWSTCSHTKDRTIGFQRVIQIRVAIHHVQQRIGNTTVHTFPVFSQLLSTGYISGFGYFIVQCRRRAIAETHAKLIVWRNHVHMWLLLRLCTERHNQGKISKFPLVASLKSWVLLCLCLREANDLVRDSLGIQPPLTEEVMPNLGRVFGASDKEFVSSRLDLSNTHSVARLDHFIKVLPCSFRLQFEIDLS